MGASGVHGVGVFATGDIREGELVEICPAVPLYFGSVAERVAESLADWMADVILEGFTDENEEALECGGDGVDGAPKCESGGCVDHTRTQARLENERSGLLRDYIFNGRFCSEGMVLL